MEDRPVSPRAARRRRLPNVKGGRQFSHRVTLSADDEVSVRGAAAARQVTIPRFLLESGLAVADGDTSVGLMRSEKDEVLAVLLDLRRIVSGVGVNANQVAHNMNATGEISSDWREVAASAHEAMTLIQSLVKERL